MKSPPAGTMELGQWTVTRDAVAAYLGATSDRDETYDELEAAPPLAIAAWALGALLEKLSLPTGAIHASQELEWSRPARMLERLHCTALPGQPTQRGELQFITVSFAVHGAHGDTVLRGKSTVIVQTEVQWPYYLEVRLRWDDDDDGDSNMMTMMTMATVAAKTRAIRRFLQQLDIVSICAA